ncbi:MAG: hypothetical protein JWN52_3943 [Actinomycetia bacterium]|nr:hypothetical protein [Actinomycetes bacterium]
MSAAGKKLPDPDLSGTDPDETLKTGFSLGQPSAAPTVSAPSPHSGTGVHEQGTGTASTRPRRPRKKGTRPDPEGMKRVSYYISADVAAALDEAVEEVLIQLGGDVPKHQVLSALLAAGAGHIADVTAALAQSRAAELAAQLEALRQQQGP